MRRGYPWDQGGEQAGELFFCPAAYLHDVIVEDGFGGLMSVGDHAGGHVGDDGDPEDIETHVAGDEDFVDGGHADEVCAEGAEGADLGGGFVGGAEDGEVDALRERDVLAGGFFEGQGAKEWGVSGGHVEEAQACAVRHGEARFVGAVECVHSGEVDVIGDGDQRALPETGVDASGGVGYDESFAAEQAEDASGKCDFADVVTLVGVNTALHDGYGDFVDGAEDKVSGVALDGGGGEVGDFGVGDANGVFDLSGEVAEAGAEGDADDGPGGSGGADVIDGGLGVSESVGHRLSIIHLLSVQIVGGTPLCSICQRCLE
jgi:hypothetical protein